MPIACYRFYHCCSLEVIRIVYKLFYKAIRFPMFLLNFGLSSYLDFICFCFMNGAFNVHKVIVNVSKLFYKTIKLIQWDSNINKLIINVNKCQ